VEKSPVIDCIQQLLGTIKGNRDIFNVVLRCNKGGKMTEDELGREEVDEQYSNNFFDIIIHEPGSLRGLSGICVGFERGEWRCARLSKYLFEYLPEFALTHSELIKYKSYRNAVPMLRKAAKIVYQTKKFKYRGEFGELILHVVLRETFNTIPAISKIYYKDSVNETVKGFDAVHVVNIDNSLELWLGEVKFYSNYSAPNHKIYYV